jgi:hypothetical protein
VEKTACTILAASILVAGCASPDPGGNLLAERTPFHNPYAAIERFETEMDNAIHPSAGPDGAQRGVVRLRREERRAFRERARAVNSILVLREAFEKGSPLPRRFDEPPRGGERPTEPSPAPPTLSVPVPAEAP